MKTCNITITAHIPEEADAHAAMPPYRKFIDGPLFGAVANVESLLACERATAMGLPAVAGVSAICREAVGGRLLEPMEKQFVGRLVALVMMSNGYQKTGRKKAVGRDGFTNAEVFQKMN